PRAASLLRLRRGGSDGVERECAAGGAAATGGDQRASADCHGGCDTCPTTLPHRAQCSRAALPGRGILEKRGRPLWPWQPPPARSGTVGCEDSDCPCRRERPACEWPVSVRCLFYYSPRARMDFVKPERSRPPVPTTRPGRRLSHRGAGPGGGGRDRGPPLPRLRRRGPFLKRRIRDSITPAYRGFSASRGAPMAHRPVTHCRPWADPADPEGFVRAPRL